LHPTGPEHVRAPLPPAKPHVTGLQDNFAGTLGMSAGRRVEYVVVALRGAIAHCQAVDDPSRTSKTGADLLAKQLGIDLPDLLGRRYTCWETPTEYGVIRNGFEPA
ncbi:hypothetical protein ACFV3F_38120, partial [Streptomyces sp. NPDC059717]|uniref:hypothetical protein n=1 Tax=Streptomyces sp. NPDC059717 TaxID=3346922 RepID=UPI0036908493